MHVSFWSLALAGPECSTWSVRKSLRVSRRLPPRVAMGTVIFIITPWMGKKPRFCTCGGSRGQYIQLQDSKALRAQPAWVTPARPMRSLAFSLWKPCGGQGSRTCWSTHRMTPGGPKPESRAHACLCLLLLWGFCGGQECDLAAMRVLSEAATN
jgi:hypothetical protein